MNAVTTARTYVDEIHPNAVASILGGSAASGRATPTSDLDIAVLYADGHANYAETTKFRGWLVEAFVHTPASLTFWYEKEAESRRPVIADICSQGLLLTDSDGSGLNWKRDAQERMDRGPRPLSDSERRQRRYDLSALIDDLLGSDDKAETFMLAGDVFRQSSELLLFTRGQWLGGGKWVVRRLLLSEDDLGKRLAGWPSDSDRDGTKLTRLAQEVLELAGGYLQEGFTRGSRK